ncbi:MAG: hypothetical protein ABW321_35600 [Polyangiales bacterium]
MKYGLLLACLLGACGTDPPEGVFRCVADNQCPPRLRCNMRLLACVQGGTSDPESADEGPPSDHPDGSVATDVSPAADPDAGGQHEPDAGVTASGPSAPTPADQPASASCTQDSDCGAVSSCAEARCRDGRCESSFVAQGVAVPADEQVAADCREVACDGQGGRASRPNDSDLPDDGDPCHVASCSSGAPQITSAPDGTACNDTGQCSGGTCSVCKADQDCTQPNDCAQKRTQCVNGALRCEATGETLIDGSLCGEDSYCHAGQCTKAALVNGDFRDGLRGWTIDGLADRFRVETESDQFARTRLTTWDVQAGAIAGEYLKGTLSQRFVVPADALALRFLVSGGHAHVRLRDAAGAILEDVIGRDSNELHVPVSWDLVARRGQTLQIAIEDDLDAPGWSFVNVNGFDVIREDSAVLVNSQFTAHLDGWELAGDGMYFNVFTDHNFVGKMGDEPVDDPAYGTRTSVSTYIWDMAAPRVDHTAIGKLSQTFTVPPDATALRFNIHGGKTASIALIENGAPLFSISGNDSNDPKICVSWNLASHRGKVVTLVIDDPVGDVGFGFIGTSGFDLITAYNGP